VLGSEALGCRPRGQLAVASQGIKKEPKKIGPGFATPVHETRKSEKLVLRKERGVSEGKEKARRSSSQTPSKSVPAGTLLTHTLRRKEKRRRLRKTRASNRIREASVGSVKKKKQIIRAKKKCLRMRQGD